MAFAPIISDDTTQDTTGDMEDQPPGNEYVRQGSPFEGGFYTGAHSPFPIKPGPEVIDLVPYTPAAYRENSSDGFVQHQPRHEPNAIFLNGVNLIDVIASLTSRIDALENPTP